MNITVAIPTIPPRADLLARAVQSAMTQRLPPVAVSIAVDVDKQGAPATRDHALSHVTTDWVAFLDDDDEFGKYHLQACAMHAETTGADLVYPWFTVDGGEDPFPQFYGQPWDDEAPHQVPVTFLAKTAVIREVGGFSRDWNPHHVGTDELGNRAGEDWNLILRLVASGARIVHLPQRTWIWHHHAHNTSGMPNRW